MSDLNRLADEVYDEPSFVAFLASLASDWDDSERKEAMKPSSPYGATANGWENGSIGSFLDAASAWAGASSHHPNHEVPENPWRRAAQILHAGKFYE